MSLQCVATPPNATQRSPARTVAYPAAGGPGVGPRWARWASFTAKTRPSTDDRSTSHHSINNLVSPQQHRRPDRQPERLRGLEVDDELELRGLFDRQIGGLGALRILWT